MTMALSYPSVKHVIDKVKRLDHSHHYDIFNILRKYDLGFSQNNNGLFFDFDNINSDVLCELQTYLRQIQKRTDEQNNDDQSEKNESPECNVASSENPQPTPQPNKITKNQLMEECQSIINEIDTNPIQVVNVMASLDKDVTSSLKRTAINQFNIAKKKFSKQIVSDTKYITSDLLFVDSI